MTTPADEMDVALASADFFAPFMVCVAVALFIGLGIRWARQIGRSM